jgi:hypothetical protein
MVGRVRIPKRPRRRIRRKLIEGERAKRAASQQLRQRLQRQMPLTGKQRRELRHRVETCYRRWW